MTRTAILTLILALLGGALHAAALDRGLEPLGTALRAARLEGMDVQETRRAVITMAPESLTWTNAGPTPFILKGSLLDGMVISLAKDGSVRSSQSLKRGKLSESFKALTLHVPAACGDMAKLALQTKTAFQIVGKVQTLSIEKTSALAVIEADGNLQCTAGTNLWQR